MNPRLSIIVPVYNVEKYITPFMESLFFQVNDFVEIVFVNDGSTDSSLDVLTKRINLLNKNKSIKVYNQENKGVSEARNSGLRISKGEYVTFVDPDDTVTDDYIETIIEDITSGKDIYIYNARRMNEDGELQETIYVHNNNINSAEANFSVFKNGYWFLWSRVFKKKLFDNMSFPKGRRYEDLILVPKLTIKAMSSEYKKKALVNYRSSTNSITGLPNANDVDTILIACNSIDSDVYYTGVGVNNRLKELYFITLVKTLIFVSIKVYGYKKSYLLVKEIKEKLWPSIRTGESIGLKNWAIIKITFFYYIIHLVKRY